jgi:predicted helicase
MTYLFTHHDKCAKLQAPPLFLSNSKPMTNLNLKTTHAVVANYFETLNKFGQLHINHEMAVRSAFQSLLDSCARKLSWTLVPEWNILRAKKKPVRVDGALLDRFRLVRGVWEAKDDDDDLELEAQKKFDHGYPKDNILFQSPKRAILWQSGTKIVDKDLSSPEALVDILKQFFGYAEPYHVEWDEAVSEFAHRLPEIAGAATSLIRKEKSSNPEFTSAFEQFFTVCQQANSKITPAEVENMLVQHLLTERIFRKVFSNPDFSRRNVIAIEIEKVITSLIGGHFNRDEFLKQLDRFYRAIESTAEKTNGFSEKQDFLNSVYERFFQGYSPKEADTHGIVYTPQQIVSFMVASVETLLNCEFDKSLSDEGVHILDPFVGTGNFIAHVVRQIRKTKLQKKYEDELHCNEVMLLPYYIASMNIEHEYVEATGRYKTFPGICLVDTFDLYEVPDAKQGHLFAAENTARVKKQRKAPIFVILGNPPYNAGQQRENDNNKNRKYGKLDKKISETYTKASRATNKNALSDPYIRALRWATDRVKQEGIVAFVTNSGFVDGIATDGVRSHLGKDFDKIYILDLGGNVRKNPKLSGTRHNVFGIQVGVSINFLVRKTERNQKPCEIYYSSVDEFWTAEHKLKYLEQCGNYSQVNWTRIEPDRHNNWKSTGNQFSPEMLPLGLKEVGPPRIFEVYSNGVKTNRDPWAYNFDPKSLSRNITRLVDAYNRDRRRWNASARSRKDDLDGFVCNDETQISWSRDLKKDLRRDKEVTFTPSHIVEAMYRPFVSKYLYFDPVLNEEVYSQPKLFPAGITRQNRAICLTAIGNTKPFQCLMVDKIPDIHLMGDTQCFAYYKFDPATGLRSENITNEALSLFQDYYQNRTISKWDIFYYIYAVLHHTEYRDMFGPVLKRELPRIPYTPGFGPMVLSGKKLAELHTNYSALKGWAFEEREKPGRRLTYEVEKIKLSDDRTAVVYNDFLVLSNIPKAAHEYKLGNRSALEWIIEGYQKVIDERSGIEDNPNRADQQYIIKLFSQVVELSVKTMEIIKEMPSLGLPVAKKQVRAAAASTGRRSAIQAF